MRYLLPALSIAVIAGCTAATNPHGTTEVVSIGPSTYLAASHGGSSEARRVAAMEAADEYCKDRASLASVLRSFEFESKSGEVSWHVEFQCQKLL